MGIVTLPDGRQIDTGRNYLLEKAAELLSDNREFLSIISDDSGAYQAFLSFQNQQWLTPDGEGFLLGWIGCSKLVMHLRGLSEEPTQQWWKYFDDPDEPDEVLLGKIEAILNRAGWTKVR